MDKQSGEQHAAYWKVSMQRGAFEAAWGISDAVLRARAGVPCGHWPRHLQYIWDGTPLAGKRVLVRCYHGLGDTIQFIRYVPLIKEIAREVMVWAQPALLPLLRTLRGIDLLLPLHDGTPDVEYDVDVESMELPKAPTYIKGQTHNGQPPPESETETVPEDTDTPIAEAPAQQKRQRKTSPKKTARQTRSEG
jgi:hypothetical protein